MFMTFLFWVVFLAKKHFTFFPGLSGFFDPGKQNRKKK